MVIYLIGPSGVGKSACAASASHVLTNVHHADLDKLCNGKQFDWPTCWEAMTWIEAEEEENRSRLIIVDIGAGTQCLPELREYLSGRSARVILVYAPPEEVHPRNPAGGSAREFAAFLSTEYEKRKDLYGLATHKIDLTGKLKDEACDLFVRRISGLLDSYEEHTRAVYGSR